MEMVEGRSYSTEGVICKAPVKGNFKGNELEITELETSTCDDSTYISSDVYTCILDQNQFAQCKVTSKDDDSTREDFEIKLRRLN